MLSTILTTKKTDVIILPHTHNTPSGCRGLKGGGGSEDVSGLYRVDDEGVGSGGVLGLSTASPPPVCTRVESEDPLFVTATPVDDADACGLNALLASKFATGMTTA